MKALGVLRAGSLPSLRVSYFCGEALPTELAHAWSRAAPHSTVINLYGPTEAAVFSTAYTFDAAHHSDHVVVPIGTPLDGMRCLVVDEAGEPVDRQGAVGELLLSGPQVASGYWRDEPATRAAFVRRAYDGSERTWYKTGDLVSDHPDDGLLFHGRRDHQVKVRGYRAELLEVEQAVTRATGCERVAVVPRLSADGRCETLIAFCSGLRATEPEVKAACAALLPPQMVPGRFVELSPLPRNANGKVDYTQLRMIAASHVA
jgi:acyl-coenzyme A synthetase/AMP-(fatty) acid ligase